MALKRIAYIALFGNGGPPGIPLTPEIRQPLGGTSVGFGAWRLDWDHYVST